MTSQMPLIDPAKPAKKPKAPPLTETELTHRLAAKYAEKAGNGNAYAFVPQVRNAAGFDAQRTIDAYVMALWPSRGLTLTAFEIKSSRSDWTRELHKPEKAETFCQLADYFYLVVGDADIVQPGELPETWGLMVPHGKGLKVAVEAPALRDLTGTGPRGRGPRPLPPAFGRSFLAALLRSATYVGEATPEAISAAVDRCRESERAYAAQRIESLEERVEKAERALMDFQRESGLQIAGGWAGSHDPKEVGRVVRAVLSGEVQADRLQNQIDSIRSQAQRIIDATEQLRPQLGEAA